MNPITELKIAVAKIYSDIFASRPYPIKILA